MLTITLVYHCLSHDSRKKLSSEDGIIQLAIGRRIQIANLQKKFENDR